MLHIQGWLIPVLQVPEEDILAVGTTDPLADVATQAHVTARMSSSEPPDRLPKKGTGASWAPVYGELLTFDDPETRLPAIDRLEGFHPGGPCLYRRVLVPVLMNEVDFHCLHHKEKQRGRQLGSMGVIIPNWTGLLLLA